MITILGPTATGKTALAAHLAYETGGEVISADSRQVYRGMDIGTGKDYSDYVVNGTLVPCHLIDIAEPGGEYNIFEYQRDFHRVYNQITGRGKKPILCGGSGMYLEAVLKGYQLADAATDKEFLDNLGKKSDGELVEILRGYKTLHNKTDTEYRPRLLKAILVARDTAMEAALDKLNKYPAVESTIFGITFPRELVMNRIAERLKSRLASGMIEEVETLLAKGLIPVQLIKYGLEYRFITQFVTGEISREAMFTGLNIAIRQFAKRQMTWFRRMERQGFLIHWIDGQLTLREKLDTILAIAN